MNEQEMEKMAEDLLWELDSLHSVGEIKASQQIPVLRKALITAYNAGVAEAGKTIENHGKGRIGTAQWAGISLGVKQELATAIAALALKEGR